MKICIRRADGGVSLVHRKAGKDTAAEELVEKWKASADPAWLPIVDYHEVSELPSREFRNAWVSDGSVISHDMGRARDIRMTQIRVARDAELARLDVEQLKGKDVQAQKQALRDLPGKVDLSKAKTVEDLKAIWPPELPK